MTTPTDLPRLDPALLDTYDFAEVFGEGWCTYNCPPLDFARADVADLYLCIEGENDGAEWVAVGRLRDGRYFRASGGCDYTGWDCQASNSGETWPDWERFVSGLGDEHRAALGLGVDALGSTVEGL